MLFNTWTFAVFFLAVYGLYWALPRKPQNVLLLVASYVFYGYWDYRFLTLIWLSTGLDYVCGRAIHRSTSPRRRGALLLVSIAGNLSILGTFKYFNFFAGSLTNLFDLVGWNVSMPTVSLILPIGISFYTFQTMSYTIDIYRRQLEPSKSLLDFAAFVAFFPQLVAGPIERARNLLPQFDQPRRRSRFPIEESLWLVFWGLFKKMAVADRLAPLVNEAFASPSGHGGLDLIIAINAFALQIYGDFSGYSSIARGVARLLGFDLMVNFRNPYAAVSPSDFWRRWHISLSTWLRDYLYIPLGGNRNGSGKTYRNLFITMLLGGLWHGAAWNFVIWGLYHGIVLSVCRPMRRVFEYTRASAFLARAIWWALLVAATYITVCVGWLFFRAQDVGTIASFANVITHNFAISPGGMKWLYVFLSASWFLALVEVCQVASGDEAVVLKQHKFVRLNIWLFVLCSLAFLSARGGKEFIYFAF